MRTLAVTPADRAFADGANDETVSPGPAVRRDGPFPGGVAVFSVTYGDRAPFTRAMAEAAFACGVARVSVVDNGLTSSSRRALEEFAAESNGSFSLLRLESAAGARANAARGFRAALAAAASREKRRASDEEYVWILDDDNLASPDALVALAQSARAIGGDSGSDSDPWILASVRTGRTDHLRVASGESSRLVFPPPSSFLGFHWSRIPRKVFRAARFARAQTSGRAQFHPVPIPFAPYGGLFLPRRTLARLGAPDARFCLYGDDVALTSRFVASGGRLFLAPASRLHDALPSWHVGHAHGNFFARLLRADSAERVFFTVRNQVYTESRRWTRSRGSYRVNRALFMSLLGAFALVSRRWSRYRLVCAAIADGLAGELGPADRPSGGSA